MSTITTPLSWHDLQWCLRRAPRELLMLMKRRGAALMVAGGYIRSCVSNEPVNDIDLFTSSEAESSAMALELAGGDATRVKRTDNCFYVLGFRTHIQFIHRWTFTDPAACILSFDFTIARAAFWWEGGEDTGSWKSATDPRFYQDLAAKRLIYCSPVRIEEAGGSMLRVLKFYQRGYRIPLDSMGKVVARLMSGVDAEKVDRQRGDESFEQWNGRVISGLLREVDPLLDPTHAAHLPSEDEQGTTQ
jgi:hypothetical protein